MARKDCKQHMHYCNFCSFVLSRSLLTTLRLKLYLWCTRHHKAGNLLEKWCFINKCWLHKTQLIYMLIYIFFFYIVPVLLPTAFSLLFLQLAMLQSSFTNGIFQSQFCFLLTGSRCSETQESLPCIIHNFISPPLFFFVCFYFSYIITFYLTYNTYKPRLSAFVFPALGHSSARFVNI